MTWLTGFDVRSNELDGGLPTEVGLLTTLTLLYISSNRLNGDLPTEVGLLTALTSLDISSNRFNGDLPTEVGVLTALIDLDIGSNSFSGGLPTQIGLLDALMRFDISYNGLNGSLPEEFSQLTELRTLDIRSNNLPYPTTIEARIDYTMATKICPPAGTAECCGLPPNSCSAFASAVQSLTDPTECSICDGNNVSATALVVGVASAAFLALFVFVRLTIKHPQSLKRWVSTITILIQHAQVITLIGSLQLQWPRSVEIIISALSFK